jgi:acetolactate synthase-1/2/3 large subunit
VPHGDVLLAVGTRLAEASSSSWDPRFTFAAPPTRVIHIDADLAEIGRNLPTELGVVADAKLALGALAAAARGRAHRDPRRIRARHPRGRRDVLGKWAHQWTSDQFPLRPERILERAAQARPEDGFIVTDVGWNKNGVAQQFSITVRARSSRRAAGDDGLRAVGRAGREDGAAGSRGGGADRRRRLRLEPVGRRHGDGSGLPVVWLVMDNAAFGTIAGLEQMHYGTTSAACSSARASGLSRGLRRDGRGVRARRRDDRIAADHRPALREALARPADGDSGADGERADADAGLLEHQRHLPLGE